MQYIFYADVYFIQNFIIKVAVLYLAFYCNKGCQIIATIKGIVKIFMLSFCGTIFEIMVLIVGNNYDLFLMLVQIFEIPLMFISVVGKERKQVIRLIIAGYFFTILINGVLEVYWNLFGESGSYVLYLLFSCAVVIVGVRNYRKYSRIKKGIFSVELLCHGKALQVQAFYDSGNRLIDPYTKHGVHIISRKLLKKLEIMPRSVPVYIPYQSLGNEEGMLEVYYIDKFIIEAENQRINIENCPLGVTKDNLFEGKNYQIILNEEVF